MARAPKSLLSIAASLLLAACASVTYAPEEAPIYRVRTTNEPFYQYGPQQPGAPEALLQPGDEVRVRRKEFGYSLVQISSGLTGYIANDALVAAPKPEQPPVIDEAPAETPPDLPVVDEEPLPDFDSIPDAPIE